MRLAHAILFLVALGFPSMGIAGDPPKLEYVSMLGGEKLGERTIKLHGSNFGKPLSVWSNFDAKLQAGSEADKSLTLSFPPKTPVGFYGLRVINAEGTSTMALVMIDDLPTIAQAGDNHSLAKAQEINSIGAVEGVCLPEKLNYFRFRTAAGERLNVEVVARRLGSSLDGVLRLLDSNGRELAYSDDELSGPDPRLSYQFATAGEYFLEVRDVRYGGGENYRYRLRVGNFPLVAAVFPLAFERGNKDTAPVDVDVVASELMHQLSAWIGNDDKGVVMRFPFSSSEHRNQGSTPLMLLVSDGPEQLEVEPNDARDKPNVIDAKGAINGRFDKPHDRDHFRFKLKKDERIVWVARTRDVGVPTDLFLRLYDAKGAKLSEVDDSDSNDAILSFSAPADGEPVSGLWLKRT